MKQIPDLLVDINFMKHVLQLSHISISMYKRLEVLHLSAQVRKVIETYIIITTR